MSAPASLSTDPVPDGAVPAHLERGTGAPVIFLHGIGGDAQSFTPQLAAIGRHYRAIAWDMPGYGRSAALGDMTFASLVDALLRLMDRLDLPRAHLVGHSIGGMIAQELAATAPERLASLALVATSSAFGSRDGSFQESFLKARLGPLDAGGRMAELAGGFVREMIGPGADPAGAAVAERAMAAVPEATFRQAVTCLTSFDRRADLARIGCPTLLIAGESDTNAPAQTMRRMAERIAGARFVLLERAGHLPQLEQPAEFNRVLLDFLGRPGPA